MVSLTKDALLGLNIYFNVAKLHNFNEMRSKILCLSTKHIKNGTNKKAMTVKSHRHIYNKVEFEFVLLNRFINK